MGRLGILGEAMRTTLQKLKSGKGRGAGGLFPSSPEQKPCPRAFTEQPETPKGGADGGTMSTGGGGGLLSWLGAWE